jgi:hypothetical protein
MKEKRIRGNAPLALLDEHGVPDARPFAVSRQQAW